MIWGMRASISARLIPAVSTRSGRSMRRPSASRTLNAGDHDGGVPWWGERVLGQRSKWPRVVTHAQRTVEQQPNAQHGCGDPPGVRRRLMPRTRSPTGRLQHDPDRLYGGLLSCDFSGISREIRRPGRCRAAAAQVASRGGVRPCRRRICRSSQPRRSPRRVRRRWTEPGSRVRRA